MNPRGDLPRIRGMPVCRRPAPPQRWKVRAWWWCGLSLGALLSSCAFNEPKCQLPPGVTPLPPCHSANDPTWRSFDGTPFPYVEKKPAHGEGKAVVILVPGWDAVTGDYEHLTETLADHGYIVCGSEIRAQRYDPVVSRRGSAVPWHDWVRDLLAFSAWVRKRYPDKTIFYHGHSFGAVIVAETVAEEERAGKPPQVRGAILQSPAFPMMDRDPHGLEVTLGHSLGFVRIAQVTLAENSHVGPVGEAVDNCRWFHSTDRVHRGYSLAFLIETVNLGHAARVSSRTLRMPVLAMEGQEDRVVTHSPAEVKEYHEYLTHELCGGHATVKVYPNGYHLITEGKSRKVAERDILSWLDGQLGRGG